MSWDRTSCRVWPEDAEQELKAIDQKLIRLEDLPQFARELFDGAEAAKSSPLQTWSTDPPSGRSKSSLGINQGCWTGHWVMRAFLPILGRKGLTR